ncbi:platelet-activating factor acetylhydrolase, isoform II-domain-containing protein [Cantharellus anzutake]|uniref:platelet-activating factor acetylhydrolase, isoform II-domain-containing protein n=1 Tax=Cantharellus anzutake TaxID=1750568 RepID=UPI0019069EE1|nr:platelet-activating factor acetylhydrolase, isoform II-domain-containing protein [Cantharellus anzutake]KAF8325632.1 platelet-activating factor acetylhydrolase, isoform II-domain-containing protein [Cantharellus anzutake]
MAPSQLAFVTSRYRYLTKHSAASRVRGLGVMSMTESKEKVVWFPNLPQTIDGFLRMARRTPNWLYRALAYPIAAAAIYGTTFPAIPNAPFLPPPSIPEDPRINGHCTFCGEMASRGYVVCAIEHRDGTSPSSVIVMEDGKSKKVNFVCHQDLFWPDLPPHAQPPDDTHLRHVQLRMRLAEIEHVIAVMRCVTSGECSKKKPDVRTSVGKKQEYDWSKWTNGVDCRKGKVIMSGHSLGGSAAILACAEKKRFDFASVIAMDPAIQRIDPWRSKLPCPLLVVNSEEFTRSDDFPRLQRLCRYAQKGEGVFSIAGSTHPSFSDVFLIVPGIINRMIGLSTESPRVLSLAVNATAAFLQHGGDGRNHEFNTVTSEEETPTPTPPSRSNSHSHHHHRHSHLESPTSPKNLAKSAGIVIQVNTDDDGEANGFEDTASVTSSSSSHPSPTSPLSTSSHPPPLDPLAALDANEALRPLRERRGTVRVSGRGYFSDRYGSGSSAPASTSRINLGQYHTNGASRVSLAVKDWSSRVGGRIRGWSRSTSNTFSLSTPFGTPKPIPRPMGPSGVSSSTSGSASGSGSVIVDPPSDDESPSRSRRAEGLTLPLLLRRLNIPLGLISPDQKREPH